MSSKAVIGLATLWITALMLCGCGGDGSDPLSPEASATIGPEGGTITTETGASITIPAGALESETSITITSVAAPSELTGYAGIMGDLAGGIELQPDGTVFAVPVSVVIPLARELSPGASPALFLGDRGDSGAAGYPEDYSGWRQTTIETSVSEDGRSVRAEITHFSAYVIQMGLGGSTLDVLGEAVETFGDNGLGVDFATYQSWFESHISAVDDMHVYDLAGGFGYDCYRVVGIEYSLYHDLGELFENPLTSSKGETGEVAFFYNYEGDRTLRDGSQLIYHLFVNVYVDRAPPRLELTAESSTVEPGERTEVAAHLTCGSDAMVERSIRFRVDEPGSVSPREATTDADGTAETTFTAGNDSGSAAVTGEYEAHDGDQEETVSGAVSIAIRGADDERWHATLDYYFRSPDDDQGHFHAATYSGTFEFLVHYYPRGNGDVSGRATLSQSDVSVTTTSDSLEIRDVDAPETVEVEVSGFVSAEGYLFLQLGEGFDPLFTWDVYEVETGEFHVLGQQGISILYVPHLEEDVQLANGTYETSWEWAPSVTIILRQLDE